MNAFRKTLDQARDADLVDHLGQLPRARGPEPLAHPGIGRDDRLGAGVGFLAAAAHHRQNTVFRAGLPAGYRGIDEPEAALGRLRIELARDFGRSGSVIDEGRAFLHAGEGAVGAKRDRTQVVVVADAGHDKILAFGGGLRRRRGASAEFFGPRLRLGRRSVEHRHLVAPFFDEMPCHGETHNAETEKSDFSHVCDPGVCRRHRARRTICWRRGRWAGSALKTGSAEDVERPQ